jgi:hypothetical protein
MLRKTLIAACLVCVITGKASAESSYAGIWMEGNCNPNRSTPGVSSGCGGGFGVRTEHGGVWLAGADQQEFRQANIAIIPASFSPNKFVNTGYKRMGALFGFDIGYFANMNETFSFFIAPGLYYAMKEEVIREVSSNGTLSRMAFAGNKKVEYIPTGYAGIHINLKLSKDTDGRLLIGAGYHTERGYTFALGGRW